MSPLLPSNRHGFSTGTQRPKNDTDRLQLLLSLWRGEPEAGVLGWASPTLALAIAALIKPKTMEDLGRVIYPEFPDFVHKDTIPIIQTGFNLYCRR